MSKEERIAKKIARAGLCSRREAERRIEAGRVRVNGEIIGSPALNVSDEDRIEVDGRPLPEKEKTRLFLYHKPAGLMTTHKDDRGRKTVFGALPPDLPRVISVGRLDLNTEGLLLLTNNGELARYLELPATGWKRRYRVRVHGKVDEKKLAGLKNGITVEGVRYKPIEAALEKSGGTNSWITMTLTEGKNREIRRVMTALGLQVNRLIRVSYGPFNLDDLPPGGLKEAPEKILQDQIRGFFKTRE